ncbi:DUF885 family protein [Massilia sp. 9096]|uniref:DUF885 domain-containing protein n=1 Tax=Massilia sp. 9096 TaxID=1500894 RepID=UPI000691711A|nr:DUF885 domain-containing protein [Massilia sp. 9096]
MRLLFAVLILLSPLPALAGGAAAGWTDRGASRQTAEPSDATPEDAATQARSLFERDWQWRLQHQPELATRIGEHRYDGQLSDTSLAFAARRIEHARRMLERARRIDFVQLNDADRLSWELFIGDQERILARAAFLPFDPEPISAQDGLQLRLPQLIAQMPFVTEDDYRNYLSRLRALPHYVDGIVEQMREGMRTGWVAPKAVMAALPGQLKNLREHLPEGAVGAPLRALPATLSAEARDRIAVDGQAALQTAAGALQKLEEFVRTDYLPAARTTISASNLPGGQAWYALLVKEATTTNLTPTEIHALGLQEVARIRAEMQTLYPRTGFRGSYAQFLVFVRSDPRLFFSDPQALLARYRRTLVRAQAQLPALFGAIPAEELAVKPVQDGAAEAQGGAYYEAGTPERTAALVVNTSRLNTRPMWEVETLALHEGIPGHHLQVARAHELAQLPAFRRYGWYDAFGEGWALYAEGLGPELGLGRDPFSRFGTLADEQLRAARLVVDTGIHALGWTRQQALDYLNTNTANPAPDNELEVGRAIAQPGQVLSYKVGQLRILALRRQAEAALGPRFDVRAFHDALLGSGALPLDLLERQMRAWIAAQAAPAAPAQPPSPAAAPGPPNH